MSVSAVNTSFNNHDLPSARPPQSTASALNNHEISSEGLCSTGRFNLNACFKDIKKFFKNLVAPNTLIGKAGNLASKSWRFIQANWDIVVTAVSLIAISFFINPAIAYNLLAITKEFTLGFSTGVILTHFFQESTRPLIERLQSTNPILQTAVLTISSALFAPVAIFMAAFAIGNQAYEHLNA